MSARLLDHSPSSLSFRVSELWREDSAPCVCGSCDWTGKAHDLSEIGGCALTAGDASPAGRCPECDSLAHLDRPDDRVRAAAAELLAALRGCADALKESGKTFAKANPRATWPNIYELHAAEARAAIAKAGAM